MSDRLELWLVRHGETVYGAEGRIAGWADTPLSERGREEARRLAPKLDWVTFDSVWCSDLVRTKQTAALAWGEAKPSPLLREISFGSIEGHYWDHLEPDVAAGLNRFRDFHPPEGESVDQVSERLSRFLATLSPGRHLIFAHGGVIRILTRDLGLDYFIPTGSLVGVEWNHQSLLFVDERGRESEVRIAAE